MSTAADESVLGRLRERVAREGDSARRAEALVLGLADAVKATSNDQNVQRLARDLRASAVAIAATLSGGD